MGAPIIDPKNFVDISTLSGGDWTEANPLTRLQDRRLEKRARSVDATATSTQFTVTFDKARYVRTLCLFGHNLSPMARVRFTSSGFTSPWLYVWDRAWDSHLIVAQQLQTSSSVSVANGGYYGLGFMIEGPFFNIRRVDMRLFKRTVPSPAGVITAHIVNSIGTLIASSNNDYATTDLPDEDTVDLEEPFTPFYFDAGTHADTTVPFYCLAHNPSAGASNAFYIRNTILSGGSGGPWMRAATTDASDPPSSSLSVGNTIHASGRVYAAGGPHAVRDFEDGVSPNLLYFEPTPHSSVSSVTVEIDDTDNPDGYVEIGRCWIGYGRQAPHAIARGMDLGVLAPQAFEESLGGQRFYDTTTKARRFARFSVNHQHPHDALQNTLEIARMCSESRQVLFMADPDDGAQMARRSFLGTLSRSRYIESPSSLWMDYRMQFTETI